MTPFIGKESIATHFQRFMPLCNFDVTVHWKGEDTTFCPEIYATLSKGDLVPKGELFGGKERITPFVQRFMPLCNFVVPFYEKRKDSTSCPKIYATLYKGDLVSKGDLSREKRDYGLLSNDFCHLLISMSPFKGKGEDTTFCPEIYPTLSKDDLVFNGDISWERRE